jgi:hypothetical protein
MEPYQIPKEFITVLRGANDSPEYDRRSGIQLKEFVGKKDIYQ